MKRTIDLFRTFRVTRLATLCLALGGAISVWGQYVPADAGIDDGTIFQAEVEGQTCTFKKVNGKLLIGDGTNAAISVSATVFRVPSAVYGYEVVGIASNALAACTALARIDFLGAPPTVADGVFAELSAEVGATYAGEAADAWLQDGVIVDGKWMGLSMERSPYCRTWQGLLNNLRDGSSAKLAADVTQDSGDIDFAGYAKATVDLESYTLTLAASRRLAVVPSGCRFVLNGETAGRVVAEDASVATGRVVRVAANGTFEMKGGSITNVVAAVGGAVFVARDGAFTLSGGTIAGGRADFGGAVAVEGAMVMTGGEIRGNAATVGGGAVSVSPSGSFDLQGGCLAANASERTGGAVFNDGGRVMVTGGTCDGNAATAGGALFALAAPATNLVYGGVFRNHGPQAVTNDAGTILVYGGIADTVCDTLAAGFAQRPFAGGYVTAQEGSCILYTNASVMAGVFTFDPRRDEYRAAGLDVLPVCVQTVVSGTPTTYVEQIERGGPYVETIGGETWTYFVLNGKAVLGDGEHAARTGSSAAAVAIPGWINGFAVDQIGAKAFTGFANLTDVVFEGLPPTSLSGDAFDGGVASVTGSYCPAYAAAWQKVIANGVWNGLTMAAGRCLDWASVKANLQAGVNVTLLGDVAQIGGAVTLASGAVTLDLNGHVVTGEPAARAFGLSGSADLTIVDGSAAGTGSFVGSGTCAEKGGFAHLTGGLLTLAGGTVSGYASSQDGGAAYVEGDAAFNLAGGTVTGCSAANGGAFAVAGRLIVQKGTITGCSATEKGGAINLESSGTCGLVDGVISSCQAKTGAGICSVGALAVEGGSITGCSAGDRGGAMALLGGGALLANGVVRENVAAAGGSAVLARGANLTMTGGYYEGAGTETTHGIRVESGVTFKLYGGVFHGAAPDTPCQSGWTTCAKGGEVFVAKENSLAWSEGLLTAGVFTFDPSVANLVTDPYRQIVTATGGTPATWTMSVNFTVTCLTWEEVRANTLAGNRIQFGFNFNPPAQKKLPGGFVYSGRALDGSAPAAGLTDLKVTFRLYAFAKGGTALWTGVKENVKTDANGTFQVWIDDAIRTAGATNLVQLFDTGDPGYLGIAFDDGAECSPRRALITAPIANRADTARKLDDVATVGILDARGGTLTCDTLNISGAVCGTLEYTTTNTAFNVSELAVAGCTLYRHADNRIVSRHPGTWVYRRVREGDVLVYNAAKSGLLTVQSTNDCSVPLLTFPIPVGATFIWRSTPFDGRVRLTPFGD